MTETGERAEVETGAAAVLRALASGRPLRGVEVAEVAGVKAPSARVYLARLEARRLVASTGAKTRRRWSLTAAGCAAAAELELARESRSAQQPGGQHGKSKGRKIRERRAGVGSATGAAVRRRA